jgi:hypothetical protein
MGLFAAGHEHRVTDTEAQVEGGTEMRAQVAAEACDDVTAEGARSATSARVHCECKVGMLGAAVEEVAGGGERSGGKEGLEGSMEEMPGEGEEEAGEGFLGGRLMPLKLRCRECIRFANWGPPSEDASAPVRKLFCKLPRTPLCCCFALCRRHPASRRPSPSCPSPIPPVFLVLVFLAPLSSPSSFWSRKWLPSRVQVTD